MKQDMQIAICDDTKSDLIILRKLLQDVLNDLSICCNIQEFVSGKMLLESPLSFHLVFLEIKMKGNNGIEIARQIYQKNHSIKIIFQTHFRQYMKEAINKSHAFGFLEKPLDKDSVKEQIQEYINSQFTEDIYVDFKNVTYIKDGILTERITISLPIRKIIYFEYIKHQRKIKIVTEDMEYKYVEAMHVLAERMHPLGFEISRRGILLNLKKVMKIRGHSIILSNGGIVPLSQRRVADFKERINERKI